MTPSRVVLTRLLTAALLLCAGTGCVSRRLVIRSNPPGALVELDGRQVGQTPFSTDFTYYGTREVKLSMPGYETLTVQQPVRAPWYQIFPLEFVSDNLLPFRVTDRRDFTYQLQPRHPALDDQDQLLQRARGFRSQSQVGR
ncbi:MAG: PEGA domain-containing protein [Planctomycetota bacterium]|nr:MAG: PEGA domain-containing protein [Planctomycetota bacterium]REJ94723.1 MAG: PEGA domain-containing protein [Planctomycetota bacterium]REK31315.1 MAG: PEGA domain-containing protein [Planctomycetota bacterium]REK39040.1 MAG: PEGA domain-containing protein [Planctomycetota bacterium]